MYTRVLLVRYGCAQYLAETNKMRWKGRQTPTVYSDFVNLMETDVVFVAIQRLNLLHLCMNDLKFQRTSC